MCCVKGLNTCRSCIACVFFFIRIQRLQLLSRTSAPIQRTYPSTRTTRRSRSWWRRWRRSSTHHPEQWTRRWKTSVDPPLAAPVRPYLPSRTSTKLLQRKDPSYLGRSVCFGASSSWTLQMPRLDSDFWHQIAIYTVVMSAGCGVLVGICRNYITGRDLQ